MFVDCTSKLPLLDIIHFSAHKRFGRLLNETKGLLGLEAVIFSIALLKVTSALPHHV